MIANSRHFPRRRGLSERRDGERFVFTTLQGTYPGVACGIRNSATGTALIPNADRLPHAVDAVSRRVVHELCQRLRAASNLTGVTCDFNAGTVVLAGKVASYYQKQMAQEIARRIEGVIGIINDVQVVDGNGCTARTSDRPRPSNENTEHPP